MVSYAVRDYADGVAASAVEMEGRLCFTSTAATLSPSWLRDEIQMIA